MKRVQAVFSASLVCTIFAVFLVSCSSDCTGEITAGGKSYTAKAKSSGEATRLACNKYCLATDAKCEAMYGIWVDSPKGKAAGSPPKMRALSEDKQLLDCVTIECANRCIAEVAAGKLKAKVDCK